MPLPRQLARFTGIGLLQWGIDSAVMVGLSHAGMAVAAAVVIGRISGAAAGYLLNGRYTFANTAGSTLGRQSLKRFVLFWLATTALSAWLLDLLAAQAGVGMAWLAKPAVDVTMAVAGFIAARQWIYRNR